MPYPDSDSNTIPVNTDKNQKIKGNYKTNTPYSATMMTTIPPQPPQTAPTPRSTSASFIRQPQQRKTKTKRKPHSPPTATKNKTNGLP
jgi:hypothetical protein